MPHPGVGFPIPPFEWPHVGRQWPPYNVESNQAKGLVGWWPTLASQEANVLRDLSGYGANGVLSAGTVIAFYPVVGAAFVWDGGVRTATIGDPDQLKNLPLGDFCASWWHLADNAIGQINQYIWGKSGATAGWRAYTRLSTSLRLGFYVYYDDVDAFAYTEGAQITDGLWHQLLMRFDSSLKRIHLYINGVEAAYLIHTDGVGNYDVDTDLPLVIGANDLDGAGADFRLYNRGLTDTEAWQLYDPATRWELSQLPQRLWRLGAIAPPPPTIIPIAMHHYRSMRL